MKTFRMLCVVTLLLFLLAGLTSLASATNQPRIVKHIDEAQLSIMHGNTRPEAMNRKNDRGPVVDTLDLDHILLQLQRSPEQEKEFQQLIDEMSNDRNSPNFHKWLTADEIGQKFGVAQEDLDTVSGWLQYHGFRINQIYPASMVIDFAGTAGQVREAFHTSIHNIEVNGEQHIANINDPTIPDALSPVVKGIVSLHNFMPKPMYIAKPDMTFAGCTSSATLKAEPGKCYAMTANDTATVYNLNPLFSSGYTGTGQVIAVVEDTDTYDTTGSGTEWTTYRNAFGLNVIGPSATYVESHPGCTDPGHNADDGEAAIDVEMATTTAPNAEVELISCPSGAITFGGLIALQGLVNAAGPYPGTVSVSYGVDEGSNGNGGNLAFYSVYQAAAAEGTTVFGASGDNGPSAAESGYSADPTYGDLAALSVSGWTETPYNVSVGGTDFEDVYDSKQVNTLGGFSATVPLTTYWNSSNTSTYGSAKSYIPEIPWNDSCASVLISEVTAGTFVPYGASPATCNNATYDTTKGYMSEAAGAGGPSNCALLNGGGGAGTEGVVDVDCMGYPKPGFQSGASLTGGQAVYGQNTDQVRDTPDVSMFAANGTWGHFQTVCWNDPAETASGAVACTGAPSTWSGFGGTSIASPTMAGIQALVNQRTGENWGIGALTNYYQMGQTEYGNAGGTFAGSSCNANGNGGPANSCVWNDVTQGDISLPCFYNYSESDCYKTATSQSHGVTVTDTIINSAVIFGGSGYTSAPTCTIAGPSNSNPYYAPSGTQLYAGGTQATCTANVSTATTTAVWKVTFLYGTTDEQGIEFVMATPSGGSATTYTMPSCSTSTVCATDLAANLPTGSSLATCTSAAAVATCTAKTAGDAGNFVISFGNAGNGTEFQEELAEIANSTIGQGPNYVSSITITNGGSGYGPSTPITLSGVGVDAVAIANTVPGTPPTTAASGYQPAFGAASGWDMATGLGSPNGTNFACNSIWGSECSQTITCTTVPPSSAAYNSNFTIACTASSGLPVAYTSSGSCSNSGATYHMTSGAGTCTVDVDQAGNSSFSAATEVQYSVNATMANDSLTFTTPPPASAEYGSSFTVAATGSAGDTGAISYSSDGVVCTNSGATYTVIQSSGTCVVSASQAADANYNAGSVSANVNALPANATVGVSLTSGSNPSTYGQSITFTATVSSDTGAVKGRRTTKRPRTLSGSLTWSGNTGCSANSISGNPPQTATCTTSILGGGTDTVTATYSDSNHNTGSGSIMQTVNPAANTVTFTTPAPASAEYGSSFTVAASGLGTGAITYTSDGVVCTNSGATYTMISGTGTCTVTATQAADANYQTASASESVTAQPAVGSVSVALTSGSNPSNYGDSITFTATVTSDTGAVKGRRTHKRPRDLNGNVTWSGNTGCSASAVSGASGQTATCTTSILPVGNPDVVTATYTASDSNHTTASGSINQTVNSVTNTVTFTTPPPSSAEYGSSFTVAASGQGTGAITYTSDGVVCSNSGATYTMISGSGTCSVTATQAADMTYPQGSATDYVTAEPAVGNVSVSLTSGSNPSTYGQSITFTATVTSDTGAVKGRKTTKRPRDLNGSVAWSGNTGCASSAVSGNPPQTATCTTSILGGGSDTVTATYTASDSNHTTAAGSINQTVNPAANTITFTTPAPASAEYGSNFTVAASGLGSNVIVYTSDGVVCTNSGATYTMISGSGTCTVTASQASDSNYQAGSASESVAAQPAVGSVSVTLASGSNPSNYGDSITFTATVTSDTGAVKGRRTTKRPRDLNGNVTWSGNTGCSASSVSGSSPETASCTTSILGGGTDTVTATYTASDSNHTTASGSINQTVNPVSQTITVTQAAPASAVYNSNFTVSATASSSLAVSISTTGSCSGSGSGSANILMTSGTGSCLVTFSQAGNANYSAAANVNESTNATPASQSITVTMAAPATSIDGSSFNVAANANSGLGVSISGSGSCSGSGTGSATITMGATAPVNSNCLVTYTQAGNSNYSAATTVTSNTKVVKPTAATYTFVNNGTTPEQFGATFTVTASSTQTGASTSTPVIATNTPAICSVGTQTVSGPSVTAPVTMLTGSGSCYLKATWAINSAYKGEVKHFSVMAAKVVPTVSFTGAPSTANKGDTFVVTANSNESAGVTAAAKISSTTGTVCSVSATSSIGGGSYQATVTMKQASGTCTVKAAWPTTVDYDAASLEQSTTAE